MPVSQRLCEAQFPDSKASQFLIQITAHGTVTIHRSRIFYNDIQSVRLPVSKQDSGGISFTAYCIGGFAVLETAFSNCGK